MLKLAVSLALLGLMAPSAARAESCAEALGRASPAPAEETAGLPIGGDGLPDYQAGQVVTATYPGGFTVSQQVRSLSGLDPVMQRLSARLKRLSTLDGSPTGFREVGAF